ncbi:hypothetical protein ACQB60_07260 [Actinomycetota bacterium Odt1-20B]
MPITPDVVITRKPSGNVMAEGGDQLALTLLKRAGFVIETVPNGFWYRLPWDMGEKNENEMASHAARMLTAVGYHVDLDPSLRVGPITTPSDPRGTRVYGHQILALIDQLNGADTYEVAATAAEHVLDPDDGVLVRLADFFESAAEQADSAATESGWALAYRFEDAAAALSDIGEDLREVSGELRALGPTPTPAHAPAWQEQVADYLTATRARHTKSTPPTPPPPTAAPPTPPPRPGRSR